MGAGCLVATLVMKHADEAAQDPRLPPEVAVCHGKASPWSRFLPLLFSQDRRKMNERGSVAYWPARQKCIQRVQQRDASQDRGLPRTWRQPGVRAGCPLPASRRV